MEKTIKKGTDWAVAITAFLAALGIGGLFVAGGFQNVVLLKLLPLVFHQVVGWVMIGGTVLAAVLKLVK